MGGLGPDDFDDEYEFGDDLHTDWDDILTALRWMVFAAIALIFLGPTLDYLGSFMWTVVPSWPLW